MAIVTGTIVEVRFEQGYSNTYTSLATTQITNRSANCGRANVLTRDPFRPKDRARIQAHFLRADLRNAA